MKRKLNDLKAIVGLSLSCLIVFALAFALNRTFAHGTFAPPPAQTRAYVGNEHSITLTG